MELRESGIDQAILVLGRLFPYQLPEAVKRDSASPYSAKRISVGSKRLERRGRSRST